MVHVSKEQKEREQLEHLRALLPNFPAGELIEGDEPDFLILGQRTVGIELTELHRKPAPRQAPFQEVQAIQERMIRARDIYVAAGHPPVQCNFLFRGQVGKTEVEGLARLLTELAVRNVPELGQQNSEEFAWDNRDYFPEVLAGVNVLRHASIDETLFGGWGPAPAVPLRHQDVQRVIQAKEGKVPAYLTRCDEVWLVIVVDSEFMSTWFHGDDGLLDVPVSSRFTRVLLVSRIVGTVRCMRVERPTVAA